MPDITNLDLCEYVRVQCDHNRPYWMGTFGQISTKELYLEKKRDYPRYYTADDFLDQLGVKVHDCIGLAVKGALMSANPDAPAVYNPKYDVNANTMITLCEDVRPWSEHEEIPGLFVWKPGHCGCYLGNGLVGEAKGHKWGCVYTKDTKWEKCGRNPWIKYVEGPEPVIEFCNTRLPVLRQGMHDESVGVVQMILNRLKVRDDSGKELTVDNNYGPKTAQAVIRFKVAHGLYKSDEINTYTWQALITA